MAIKRHEKPCIQCRHFSAITSGREVCRRPVAATPCPVNGLKITPLNRSAYTERSGNWSLLGRQKCGPEGRHFWQGMPGSFLPTPPNQGSGGRK